MTPKPRDQPTESNALATKQSIPVLLTDKVIFDNGYASMKERFKREMSRIDEQMNKFSTDLMNVYGETSTVQKNVVNSTAQSNSGIFTGKAPTDVWEEVLKSSPLVVGQENDQFLKLQFDVSQFDPTELNVRLLNDMLIVTASHEEKSANTTVYREYNRQFKLPPGVDPEMVVATLSQEGVLTVETPIKPQRLSLAHLRRGATGSDATSAAPDKCRRPTIETPLPQPIPPSDDTTSFFSDTQE